ncbi:MAG TPA: BspA family leucine-rich repeat surface protein, partial [Desulfobacterales bacterium]|nr:BspA family leucine-rich repeat surface protein [Desulfobacterales bacterium]
MPISLPICEMLGLPVGDAIYPSWCDGDIVYPQVDYPPVSDSLVVWLKGEGTDIEKADSWVESYAESMVISDSACMYVNGIDEKLLMPDMPSDATITYQGTATAVVNTSTKEITFTTEGTFYDLKVYTANNEFAHFPIAETSPTAVHSFDTTGAYSITWIGTLANMRAGRQDSYHYNATQGYWTINGDDTRYPYAVPGFDAYHKGGTWNNAESLFAFKEEQIGSPDGVSDELTMLVDHGTIVSSEGTSIPSYTHPTVSMTAGTIRALTFSDGTILQINEGEGSDIHDSEGNIAGTLSGTPENFWANTLLPQPIMDMEAVHGELIFSDNAGHSIKRDQDYFEATLNNNRQYFFYPPVGLFGYGRQLTVAENTAVEYYLYKKGRYEDRAPFVSTWRTVSVSETITLPANGVNSFWIDWGDGQSEYVTTTYPSHVYAIAGNYQISITGKCTSWYQNNEGDKDKIISVENLGICDWLSFKCAFYGCSNITSFTTGLVDVSSVTSMYRQFSDMTSVTTPPDVSNWDTSSVTSMSYQFHNMSSVTIPP